MGLPRSRQRGKADKIYLGLKVKEKNKKMKKKYCYESDKDFEPADALILGSLALFIIAFIKRDAIETKVFFTLLAISLVLFICWIIYLNLQGSFTADDKAVTFGKFSKKRIEYSSIKSIDICRSTKTRRKNHKRYAKLVEWITFHCEDGDHRFAGVLVPERECSSPGSEMSMFKGDWSVSPFWQLKSYIEEQMKL